jgi:hypothetical protein
MYVVKNFFAKNTAIQYSSQDLAETFLNRAGSKQIKSLLADIVFIFPYFLEI